MPVAVVEARSGVAACSPRRPIPIRAACSWPIRRCAGRGARFYALPEQMPGLRALSRTCPAAASRRDARSRPRTAAPDRSADRSWRRARDRLPASANRARGSIAVPEPRRPRRRPQRTRLLAAGRHWPEQTLPRRRGLLRDSGRIEAVRDVSLEIAAGRVRRRRRRKRQRQDDAGAPADGPGRADLRPHRPGRRDVTACSAAARRASRALPRRWCSRTRNRRSIRAAASARSSRRRWRRLAAAPRRARAATRAGELLREMGLAPEMSRPLPRAALRRPAPARQHRARALRRAASCWWPTKSSPGSTYRCRRSC